MREITANAGLVAFCGLYCGACGSYLKERCPGCHENTKATWCTVRKCCQEMKLASCAECREFPDPRNCRKFNNAFSKVIGFLLRSNRPACLAQIKTLGLAGHAGAMARLRRQSIRR